MKAAILHAKETIRIEDIAPKALQPGEVRMQVEAALTCGTDLKVFKRGYHAKMIVPPAVFGHEMAGVISELGAVLADSPWKIGNRVVVANSAPCGECFYCRESRENLCEELLFLNGAYAESMVIPARLVAKNLLKVADTTEFHDAALTEPLACVVQGVEDCRLKAGQNVLILGTGPIGLMFVALAKNLGCHVTAVGRRVARLAAAVRLGAEQVIDIGDGSELVTKVKAEVTNQFDVVIEAVGRPEVWDAATQLVRKGGVVNFFGGCPAGTTVQLDTTLIHYSNLTLLASFHHTPRTIRRALGFIQAGVIRAADFVDGECGLSRLPELFAAMAAGNQGVKTLIKVRE